MLAAEPDLSRLNRLHMLIDAEQAFVSCRMWIVAVGAVVTAMLATEPD